MNPTELIVEWLEGAPDLRDAMGEMETFSDVNALQEALENRIRKEGDQRKLRDDMVKYATQYAPKEIGDLKGFLDWSLGQVDWQTVARALAPGNADEPAAPIPQREAAS
jgi:hypothetical protein